jgi:hypothetical protein
MIEAAPPKEQNSADTLHARGVGLLDGLYKTSRKDPVTLERHRFPQMLLTESVGHPVSLTGACNGRISKL